MDDTTEPTPDDHQPKHRAVPCINCGLGQHRHMKGYYCGSTPPIDSPVTRFTPEEPELELNDDGLRRFQVEVQFEVTVDPTSASAQLYGPQSLEDKVRTVVDDVLELYVTPRLLPTNNRALTVHWEILPDSVSEYDGESFVRCKPS